MQTSLSIHTTGSQQLTCFPERSTFPNKGAHHTESTEPRCTGMVDVFEHKNHIPKPTPVSLTTNICKITFTFLHNTLTLDQ